MARHKGLTFYEKKKRISKEMVREIFSTVFCCFVAVYDKIADAGIAETEIQLEGDEYFVLGDNRNVSEDSRSGNIGPVRKDTIAGEAWFYIKGRDSNMGFVK